MADAVPHAFAGSFADLSQELLELVEGSIGFWSGEKGARKSRAAPPVGDDLSGLGAIVARQIVADDDVTEAEFGGEVLVDILGEYLPVYPCSERPP